MAQLWPVQNSTLTLFFLNSLQAGIDREAVADFTGFCDGFAVGSMARFRLSVAALRLPPATVFDPYRDDPADR